MKNVFKACSIAGLCLICFIAGVLSNELRTGVSKSPAVSSSMILDLLSPNQAYAHTHSPNCYVETYAEMWHKSLYAVYAEFCTNSTKFTNSNSTIEYGYRWACQQAIMEAQSKLEALPHY